MLGSADGDIALGMGRGQISNLLMELAGIDIYESLKFLIGKDHKVPIRCAFGDFSVEDGLMNSRALAFDNTDTIIVGEGTVNLRAETLALLLNPRPKDRRDRKNTVSGKRVTDRRELGGSRVLK